MIGMVIPGKNIYPMKNIPFEAICVGLILLTVTGTTAVYAQSAGFAGSFSRVGFGPRGMAMGNSLAGVVQEGMYAYYNPAHAAAGKEGNQVDLSTSIMTFDRSLHMLNGTFRLPPGAGLTLSIINGNVSNIDGRTSSGYHTGELSTNEYQISGAFGLRLTPELYAGFGVKYYVADFHAGIENATSFGFDLGLLYRHTDKIILGMTVQDLLSKYSWRTNVLYGDDSSGNETERFPLRARLGISYEVNEALLVSLEPGMLLHLTAETVYQLNIGVRYRLHERIALRGGWQSGDLDHLSNSNRFSAGFSVNLPFDLLSPSVDYAFIPEPNRVSIIHVFGFRLNL